LRLRNEFTNLATLFRVHSHSQSKVTCS